MAKRVVIGVQFFLVCMIIYMLRVNLSVNIVAMVKQHTKPPSETDCVQPFNTTLQITPLAQVDGDGPLQEPEGPRINIDYGERYEWDNQVQGFILGAYYWGYIPACLVAGALAEKSSAKIVVAIAVIMSAILTALTPVVCKTGYVGLLIVRILLGAFGGLVYPCLHCMLAKWVPPAEKGKFVAALMGGTFGTVATFSVIGFLIEWSKNWVWAFYGPAALSGLWVVSWFMLVFDSPEDHPTIGDAEKKYISDSLGANVNKEKQSAPLKDILTSFPFWSLVILHAGNLWGLYFLLTVGPKFLSEILGFNMEHSGLVAGVPYMARLIAGFIFGSISDYMRKNDILQVTTIRKFFCLFSHIIPGLLLLCLLFTECDVVLAVALLTASLGFNGASTVTNLQNHQDLSPNYAGTLYGIMNALGSFTGIISPAIVGAITKNNNNMHDWHICFVIGAVVYFVSTAVFLVKGTADEQEWNNQENKQVKTDANEPKDGKVNEGFTYC